MIYSDHDIAQDIDSGEIAIEGLVDGSIQPASVDFHLSDRPFKVWSKKNSPIIPWQDQSDEMVEKHIDRAGEFCLYPGEFALASTTERVKIGNQVAGRLEGRSSLARLGLIVHTTAGFFDPGFEGYPTLELLNVSPRLMLLRPGMSIAQMAFFQMTSPVLVPYSKRGHYTDQGADPEPSHYYETFD